MDDRRGEIERRAVNPWTWQDQFGFSQAVDVTGAGHLVLCAGQTSVDEEGNPLHERDMAAQMTKALDNLEEVLRQAGLQLSDVVRLNYYTTDVDAFFEAFGPFASRLGEAGCRPASTVLGVARLAFPSLRVEIEATAVAP